MTKKPSVWISIICAAIAEAVLAAIVAIFGHWGPQGPEGNVAGMWTLVNWPGIWLAERLLPPRTSSVLHLAVVVLITIGLLSVVTYCLWNEKTKRPKA